MIEFIVLGQVPGTQIYLQFSSVLLLIALVASLGLAVRIFSKKRTASNAHNQAITNIAI